MDTGIIEPMVSHNDPIAPVIFGVTLILVAALVGRYAARALKQTSVLGELLMGVLLGNLLYLFGYDLIIILREGIGCTEIAQLVMAGMPVDECVSRAVDNKNAADVLRIITGPNGSEYLAIAQAVDVFSRYGVIFLLFHVGLNTCIAELKQVDWDSIRVAIIGVVVPFALGFMVSWWLLPSTSHSHHMFLGATLGATSIGITARVLQDLNKTTCRESHVILGAAVMDDLLGLVMLSIVSGIVVTGNMDFRSISETVFQAFLFITVVLMLGPYIIRVLIRLLRKLDEMEAKLFISFVFVMTLAWFANLAGLATIIGAFAAGLLLLDSQFTEWGKEEEQKYSIQELFAPIEAILVPIFFVLMGIQVKLETFLDWNVLLFAGALIIVAVIGKLAAGLGAFGKLNKIAVGIGMMPRGEVGLVFASIGKTLGVIDSTLFSAVVLMVIFSTLITPPLLKIAMANCETGPDDKGKVYSKLCK
ncbi:cation:proton antiporter [Solemya velum gill symbiont]|uniref:cation:proton antiporter n=1 Tax=Solemya velum gill symbiont TaxID=2340 RepID=UPI001E392153|nr:cation:proton antiporter [Solemya velum gill symbiont]